MKKIAVICAHLPDRNTGMLTVDLAAHTILRDYFPESQITLFSFARSSEVPYESGESSHSYLDIAKNSEKFLESDIFLYWGDFIHSHSYWEYDMGLWINEIQALPPLQRKEALEKLHSDRDKFIFLSGQPLEKLKQTVVFGSTIITNEAHDNADSNYTTCFNNFFANIGNVYFRDALSASKVSPLRQSEATLGCDCAFLLRNEDLYQLKNFQLSENRTGVGLFLGRSPSKLKMMIFAKMVANQMNEDLSWLPWFSSFPKMRFAAKFFGLDVPQHDVLPGDILSKLSGYRFVITDTYHICVNAWRMGIPAVCIGQGTNGSLHSLSDKKKEILFEQYGGRRLYVFLERISSIKGMRKEVARICKEVSDNDLTSAVAKNVQEHRSMALNRLVSALKALHN